MKLMERLEKNPGVSVVRAASPNEVTRLARQAGNCVLVCFASNQEQMVRHVTLLKLLADMTSSKALRIYMTMQFPKQVQEHIAERVKAYGVTDVLHEPVNERSFAFKIERAAKVFAEEGKAAQRVGEKAEASASRRRRASESYASGGASRRDADKARATVKLGPPLTLKSDFWCLTGGNTRRVGGRWLILLRGPGPSAGRWVPTDSHERDKNANDSDSRSWKWIPMDAATDKFHVEPGNWIFRGDRQPEFHEEIWTFAGRQPALEFLRGSVVGSKFQTDETGSLIVAKDSEAAIQFMPAIQATWHKVIRKSAEQEARELEQIQEKKRAKAEADEAEARVTGDGESVAETEATGAPQIVLGDPLGLESDCWLGEDLDPKFVNGRWLVRLRGPTPVQGKWAEVGDLEWEWKPADPDTDPFIREQGAWVFRGQAAPHYERRRWVFAGPAPFLEFRFEGQSYGAKFGVTAEGHLLLAADSPRAAEAMAPQRTAPETPETDDPEKESSEAPEGSGRSGSKASEKLVVLPSGTRASGDDADYVDEREGAKGGKDFELEPKREKRSGKNHEIELERARARGINNRLTEDDEKPDYGATQAGDGEDVPEYRYAIDHFGAGEGWEIAADGGGDGYKWHVFVPFVVSNGASDDLDSLVDLWALRTRLRVERSRDRTEWIFRANRPEKFARFTDLPAGVQRYLRDRGPGPVREDLSLENQEEGKRLEHRSHPVVKDAADFADQLSKQLEASGAELPPGTAEELRKAKASIQVDVNAPHPDPAAQGPESMKATEVPGPTLSPLAFAFLMSELLCKRDFTLTQVASRYCAYVSSSCGGLRAELWFLRDSKWCCGGWSSSTAGDWARALESAPPGASPLSAPASGEEGVIATVERADGKRLGAVVIYGKGAYLVAPEYAVAIALMTRGLLISLLEAEAEGRQAQAPGVAA